jgi:hypothetical protein
MASQPSLCRVRWRSRSPASSARAARLPARRDMIIMIVITKRLLSARRLPAAITALLALGVAACGGASSNGATTDPSQAQGQNGYGQPSTGTYGQSTPQTGYSQTGSYPQSGASNQQSGYGQTAQPTTATTATTAASPLAVACQSDATCLTHRCNLQTGRCSVPCASNADCIAGNGCVVGLCIPGMATSTQ